MNNNYSTEVKPIQLSYARKLLGVKQKDVAQSVNLTVSNYNIIENAKSDPKVSTYNKIIQYFRDNGVVFHSDGNVTLSNSKE